MYALMHVDFNASERPPRTCLALTSILLIIFEKRQVGLQTFEFISVQDSGAFSLGYKVKASYGR